MKGYSPRYPSNPLAADCLSTTMETVREIWGAIVLERVNIEGAKRATVSPLFPSTQWLLSGAEGHYQFTGQYPIGTDVESEESVSSGFIPMASASISPNFARDV